jgi:hypothetical protein
LNILISTDAISFVKALKKRQHPALVIYRDVMKIGCCNSSAFTFIPKLKITDNKKLDKYFMMIDTKYGIPVWIENGLLTSIEDKCIVITLNKGIRKGLKLQIISEMIERGNTILYGN